MAWSVGLGSQVVVDQHGAPSMLRAIQPCRLIAATRASAVLHAFAYDPEQSGSFKNNRCDWCHKAQLDRYPSAPLLERVRLEALFGPTVCK